VYWCIGFDGVEYCVEVLVEVVDMCRVVDGVVV